MKTLGRRIEFHTHSLLSDGELLPSEILRRAENMGYEAVAVTDHVDSANLESVVTKLTNMAEELEKYAGKTRFYPGVELTHVPPKAIGVLASKARRLGAKLVIAHGETLVEPVTRGTNLAAVESGEVDILAHPGMISEKECEKASGNGVYLELTTRKGHCLTNGFVAKQSLETGANLVVNTDLHSPEDFITQKDAYQVALGAGLSWKDALVVVRDNPRKLLKRLLD
ncbi:histidinol phosphate phosphatase domain-containing protein [Candidatus Hecatella orcuttiae]|jgi:putative hydrolase|uniref:histidinol phosphate phosphatase domain-containing protein n=1 Tax=Candidatus Hecatella orcuttiae TaxID=1935119 RepID=UPI002868347A|nr:histidinol phosphate phosphatase domain-containing protein [Candidatus Hecatella orcuttiae]